MSKRPPIWPLKFFRWFCHPDYAEDIEGDLLERFQKRPSTWHFVLDILRLFRPALIKEVKITAKYSVIPMLIYFLKIGLRNFKRPRVFSVINFLSFSTALTASFLIYQYVNRAYQADSFFSQKDKIYRLVRKVEDSNASYRSPTLAAPYSENFVDMHGVEEDHITRLLKEDELVTHEGRSFFEEDFFYADPSFLGVLDFPLALGDPKTALEKPNSVVISQKIAAKYFGTKNPLGEVIEIDNKGSLEVSGVLGEIPAKSHLNIGFLAPMGSLGYGSRLLKDQEAHVFTFYFLQENYNLPSKLHGVEKNTQITYQPLHEIFFDSSLEFDDAQHESENLLKSLTFIALLILTIAGANFLNLILSSSLRKVKDLGVRKVLGSNLTLEVTKQLVETYLVVFVAFIFSIVQCLLVSAVIDSDIYRFEPGTSLLISIPLLTLILTVAFALVPCLISSTAKASDAIERKIKHIRVRFLQEGILVAQLLISMLLMFLSILVSKQFNYMQNREIGINADQVLYFTSNNKHSFRNLRKIKAEIEGLTGIKEVAMSIGGLPGSTSESITYNMEGLGVTRQLTTAFTSLNFPKLLDIQVIEGRSFDVRQNADLGTTALVNETAAYQLGWPQEDILGKSIEPLNYYGQEGKARKIIGIVRDYHFDSFKKTIEPLAILSSDIEETVIVKLTSQNASNTISAIGSIWNKYVPKYPFEYHLLDERFLKIHEEDTKQRNLLYLFSGLAIIISIAGFLSLSAYLLQARRKEIALRSVLGATASNLLSLFLEKHFKLLIISSILCSPAAFYLGSRWLKEFSYRITLSVDIFITGISAIVLLMVLVLSLQIFFSTKLNPAKELSLEN